MKLSRHVSGTSRLGVPVQQTIGVRKMTCFLPKAPVAAARARMGRLQAFKAQEDVQEGVQGLRGPETLVLPTIFANSTDGKTMLKANVVLPPSLALPKEGARISVQARGVVLFMHGFAQGPTAYARMLTQLAKDANVVIVAPNPPFAATVDKQQSNMVDCALFWRDLIARNQLPGLQLLADTNVNVGLLGHSVGGGLAAYVADAAAKSGQAFTSAHVMAPQTSKVVPKYSPSKADGGDLLQGVPTEWGLQYGFIDLLSYVWDVQGFRKWLQARSTLRSTVQYELGTHVGFEDQLVAGRESFSINILPWVVAVLSGVLSFWLPWLGLRVLDKLRGDNSAPASATPADPQQGKEGSVPSQPGFGVPDDVELPDERYMFVGYVLLAAAVTAVERIIPGFSWEWSRDALSTDALSVLKGVFLVLAVGSWPSLVVYPYEAVKQRPEARRQVVQYFQNTLVPAAPAVVPAVVQEKVLA